MLGNRLHLNLWDHCLKRKIRLTCKLYLAVCLFPCCISYLLVSPIRAVKFASWIALFLHLIAICQDFLSHVAMLCSSSGSSLYGIVFQLFWVSKEKKLLAGEVSVNSSQVKPPEILGSWTYAFRRWCCHKAWQPSRWLLLIRHQRNAESSEFASW